MRVSSLIRNSILHIFSVLVSLKLNLQVSLAVVVRRVSRMKVLEYVYVVCLVCLAYDEKFLTFMTQNVTRSLSLWVLHEVNILQNKNVSLVLCSNDLEQTKNVTRSLSRSLL